MSPSITEFLIVWVGGSFVFIFFCENVFGWGGCVWKRPVRVPKKNVLKKMWTRPVHVRGK